MYFTKMNKREFFQWLREQKCEVRPKEGINNTAPPIEIVNTKNNRYSYFASPYHTDTVSRKAIEKIIRDLGIEPPPNF